MTDMKNKVVEGTTCFTAHSLNNVNCKKIKCAHWVGKEEYNNCSLIGAQSGPKTLQEIGEIYGLTRMRICQIEKNIYKKLKVIIESNS